MKLILITIGFTVGIGVLFLTMVAFINIFEWIRLNKIKEYQIQGYDKAVNDILEYGWYYNKDNKRIYIHDYDIPTWNNKEN